MLKMSNNIEENPVNIYCDDFQTVNPKIERCFMIYKLKIQAFIIDDSMLARTSKMYTVALLLSFNVRVIDSII